MVLTNGNTASAAEIVSGAVQDLDVGVIVGTGKGVTYGKGLVQNIRVRTYGYVCMYLVTKIWYSKLQSILIYFLSSKSFSFLVTFHL